MRAWDAVRGMRRLWDVLIAIALVGLAFVPGVERQGVDIGELPDRPLDGIGWMLLIAQGAGVALLRRWPTVSLAVVGVAFFLYQSMAYPTTFAALALLVVVVGAGALIRTGRLLTAAAAALVYCALAIVLTERGSPTAPLDFVVFGLLLAALWVAGAWLQSRAEAQALLRERHQRDAVDAERRRIAREMHDIVTHHVTAMVIHADAARIAAQDESTRAAFDVISDTGRAAMRDLRDLLGALRDASDSTGRDPAVVEVDELVERARAAGQPVAVTQRGDVSALPARAALAVTRVVQEGLTNAMKHAPGAQTDVAVTVDAGWAEVTVVSAQTSRRGLGRGSGQGLAGLRERVTGLGGSLDVSRQPDRFVIHARMPL